MAVAAVLVALLPAAAAAQSAGDEQYEDPLAGQQEQEQPEPAATSTPAPTPAPDADSAQAPAPATPAPSAAPAQLPRTGAEPLLIAAAGAFLLASGAALRLRAR